MLVILADFADPQQRQPALHNGSLPSPCAGGAAAEREEQVLRDATVPPQAFGAFGKLLSGTRRHNLVYVDDLTASVESEACV